MKHSRLLSILAVAALAAFATACGNGQPKAEKTCCCCDLSGKADKIVTGNIITMDGTKMRAEAMTIKNGHVQYVGSKEVAESLCDENTERVDYGEASVYPGFIDVHVHPLLAGQRMQESIDLVPGQSVDEYLDIVREFVTAHPEKSNYKGAGWSPRDRELTAKELDAICADKPILLNSIDGHSYWLNSLALEQYGFTPEVAKEDGPAQIHVDAEGNPSGVVVEESERIASHAIVDINEEKDAIMLWQDFAFGLGFTTVGDAGFGSDVDLDAYSELENEGKFKLLTYISYYQPIPGQSVEEKVAKTIAARDKYNGKFVKVSGIKMFVDGVVEGHTAWLIDEYLDEPGYYGVKKMDDHDYLVNLVKSANENGFYVHLHTIGDGAVRFAVDAIEEAQKATGIYNAHNCLAHLELVSPQDIKRMADNNIVALVCSLWTPFDDVVSPLEDISLGTDRCANAYPIGSFFNAGGLVVSHTDYPVSTAASVPQSVYFAEMRGYPGERSRSREKESITRLQALQSMTTNPAIALGDKSIGSLAVGKKANYAVFNSDFLSDPLEKVYEASIVATAVAGEVVFTK